MRKGALAGGIVAVAAYVAAAGLLAAAGRPVLPIFDGLAPPPPYRWVNPPPEFVEDNEAPLPGEMFVELDEDGEEVAPFGVTTGEAQAHISFGADSFEPREGEESIRATIVPLDPETLGPAPEELRFDGNAYEAGVDYLPSEEPAELVEPATLVMRYPVHADRLLRWDGFAWVVVPGANTVSSTLQIFVTIDELGTFAAAREPPPEERPFFIRLLPYLAAAAAVVVAAVLLVRRPSGRSKKRPAKRRPKRR